MREVSMQIQKSKGDSACPWKMPLLYQTLSAALYCYVSEWKQSFTLKLLLLRPSMHNVILIGVVHTFSALYRIPSDSLSMRHWGCVPARPHPPPPWNQPSVHQGILSFQSLERTAPVGVCCPPLHSQWREYITGTAASSPWENIWSWELETNWYDGSGG